MKRKIFTIIAAVAITLSLVTSTAYADYYSAYTTLSYGTQGSEVVNLQNDLKALGYFNGTSTGYFGSITLQSVINYQRDHHLAVDGIAGHNTARQIKVDRTLKSARSYLGVPYVWGGTTPSGFDCSGLVHYTFLKNGITLPRTASDMYYHAGTWVQKGDLRPGDLVFFTTYKPGPSHMGIYLGNNEFIHASSGQGQIVVSSLDNVYFAPRFIGAKRVIQ